jgi:hypothetical protein
MALVAQPTFLSTDRKGSDVAPGVMVANILEATQVLIKTCKEQITTHKKEFAAVASAIPSLDLSKSAYCNSTLTQIKQNCSAIITFCNEMSIKCPLDPMDLFALLSLSSATTDSIVAIERTLVLLCAVERIRVKTPAEILGKEVYSMLSTTSVATRAVASETVITCEGPVDTVADTLMELEKKLDETVKTVAVSGLADEIVTIPVHSKLIAPAASVLFQEPLFLDNLANMPQSAIRSVIGPMQTIMLRSLIVKTCKHLPIILAMHVDSNSIKEEAWNHVRTNVLIYALTVMGTVDQQLGLIMNKFTGNKTLSEAELKAIGAFRGLFRCMTVEDAETTLRIIRDKQCSKLFRNACVCLLLQVPCVVTRFLRVACGSFPFASAYFGHDHVMTLAETQDSVAFLNTLREIERGKEGYIVAFEAAAKFLDYTREIRNPDASLCPLQTFMNFTSVSRDIHAIEDMDRYVVSAIRIIAAGIATDMLWYFLSKYQEAAFAKATDIELLNLRMCHHHIHQFEDSNTPSIALTSVITTLLDYAKAISRRASI